jgi:hypothetical protein
MALMFQPNAAGSKTLASEQWARKGLQEKRCGEHPTSWQVDVLPPISINTAVFLYIYILYIYIYVNF